MYVCDKDYYLDARCILERFREGGSERARGSVNSEVNSGSIERSCVCVCSFGEIS